MQRQSVQVWLKSRLPHSLADGPEVVLFVAVACAVSSVMISIWLAERFLEVAIVALIWRWARNRKPPRLRLPFLLPLGVLFVWTMTAACVAGENPFSRHTVGKFYILVLLFLVPAAIRGARRALWAFHALFAAAAVASIAGLVQFIVDPHRSLLDRITGFQSTWMNFSGQLMLVLVMLCAYAFCFGLGKRWWVLILGLLVAAAITLSLTRNAWAGAVIGIGTVFLLRRPRLIAGLAVVLVILALAAPSNLQQRFITGFNPADPNTANRIELFQTSMRMIRDNPWFGVGPSSVARAALHYRSSKEYPDWLWQHMHNNFFQIATERGIPGLLIWLWFMSRLAWDAWKVYRNSIRGGAKRSAEAGRSEALLASIAALGAMAALMIAGLFEYNYGSSPVLIVFLLVAGAPYAFVDDSTPDSSESSPGH